MYLEIDEGFDSHPKTLRLCRVLGDVNAGQYLIRLWAWACRSSPDGDLSGMEAADIESLCRYAPADGRLYEAMTAKWSPKFGAWIDVDVSSAKLHGWDERQGAAIAKMEKRAERMRSYRAGRCDEYKVRAATVPAPCRNGAGTVPVRPDKTRQDQCPDPVSVYSLSQISLLASDPDPDQQPPCQKDQGEADQVRQVFAHYRTHHKRAFPSPVRESREWRAIGGRLREGHSVADLCRAIDGYHKSPWHRGENDRHREYLGLGLMMRDGDHVAAGIALDEQAGGPVLSERERRGARAAEAFLTRGGPDHG